MQRPPRQNQCAQPAEVRHTDVGSRCNCKQWHRPNASFALPQPPRWGGESAALARAVNRKAGFSSLRKIGLSVNGFDSAFFRRELHSDIEWDAKLSRVFSQRSSQAVARKPVTKNSNQRALSEEFEESCARGAYFSSKLDSIPVNAKRRESPLSAFRVM
jgi:hypothetical protein